MIETPLHILHYNTNRSIEWFSALAMLNWALILALPGETMMGSPSYREFSHYGFTEDRLAVALAIVGSVRVVALWINGRWPRGPMLRIAGCVVGSMIWGQIAWLIALGSLTASGTLSTGTGMYGLLAVAEILNIYKAAFDARYDRR